MKLHELRDVMKLGDKARLVDWPENTAAILEKTAMGCLVRERTRANALFSPQQAFEYEWELILEPLPIGEWITETTIEALEAILDGHRVWIECTGGATWTGFRGSFGFMELVLQCFGKDPMEPFKRIYILPDPEDQE